MADISGIRPVASTQLSTAQAVAASERRSGGFADLASLVLFANRPGPASIGSKNTSSINTAIGGSSLVSLTPETIRILNGLGVTGASSSAATLSLEELQRLASLLNPFADVPFSDAVIEDIRAALTAAGFNPQQLSIRNLLLALNFFALPSVYSASGRLRPNEAVFNQDLAEA